jgi:hypothetical protein
MCNVQVDVCPLGLPVTEETTPGFYWWHLMTLASSWAQVNATIYAGGHALINMPISWSQGPANVTSIHPHENGLLLQGTVVQAP